MRRRFLPRVTSGVSAPVLDDGKRSIKEDRCEWALVMEFKSICHKAYVTECARNRLYKPSNADLVR